jgi:putative flippase GtrA
VRSRKVIRDVIDRRKASRQLERLRSPDSGLLGQVARFAVNGCTTAFVYLLATSLIALVLGLPFEVALAMGFSLAIIVNFALHRRFVWLHDDEFALSFPRQVARYMSVVSAQYVLTAISIALLPKILGLPTEVVYLATAMILTPANFVLFRSGVFHAEEAACPRDLVSSDRLSP